MAGHALFVQNTNQEHCESDVSIIEMVTSKFERTGLSPGAALVLLVATAAGHPQRAAYLADLLWHETIVGESATAEQWVDVERQAVVATGPEFEAVERALSAGAQRKVVRLLAWEEPLYGAAAGRLGLKNKQAATTAVNALTDASLVQRDTDGRYTLVDPLFALWLRAHRGRA